MPDITDLLDRTTPIDLAPVDVDGLARRGRTRRRRRRLAVVAAPAVVLALAVGVNAARTDHDDGRVSVTDGEGSLPRLPISPGSEDVLVYIDRDITEAQFHAIGQHLDDDGRVTAWEYFDSEASMEEYRDVFAGNPEMLAEGETNPELVPTTFRIELVDDRPDAMIAFIEDYVVLDGVTRATSSLDATP